MKRLSSRSLSGAPCDGVPSPNQAMAIGYRNSHVCYAVLLICWSKRTSCRSIQFRVRSDCLCDIEMLAGLPEGYFQGAPEVVSLARLRSARGASNTQVAAKSTGVLMPFRFRQGTPSKI